MWLKLGGGKRYAAKPEGRRLLGRPRRSWVKNIELDIAEIGFGGVDWIGMA
jgi:hypothetical protein